MTTTKNIFGKTSKTSSIESALLEQIEIESVLAEMAEIRRNKFSGAAVVQHAGVAVVEYTEKQFQGPAMSDDEWASL